MEKIRVLLVDDHTILLEGIRLLLQEREEFQVVGEARDGQEALERIRELKPDVVVMDIGMPRLNGLEATRLAGQEFPGLKILILTMYEDEEYILQVLEAGASGYVLKKTAGTELINAIKVVYEDRVFLDPSVAKTLVRNYLSRGGVSRETAIANVDHLTDRELEILKLIAQGLSNNEIAEALHISVKTVDTHRTNIMNKLDLHDRVGLTKYALRKGLVDLGS